LEKNSLVGISSHNRLEWFIADIACGMYGLTVVPVHHHIKDDEREFILNQTEISTVICGGQLAAKFVNAKAKCPHLKHIVDMDNGHSNEVISFASLIEDGALLSQSLVPRSPDDLATIIYTSGSTGVPKGAMFTEKLWRTFIRMPYLIAEKHALVNVSKGNKIVHDWILPRQFSCRIQDSLAHVSDREVTLTYVHNTKAKNNTNTTSKKEKLDFET